MGVGGGRPVRRRPGCPWRRGRASVPWEAARDGGGWWRWAPGSADRAASRGGCLFGWWWGVCAGLARAGRSVDVFGDLGLARSGRHPVGRDAFVGEAAVGPAQRDGAVGLQRQRPAAVVDEVVVFVAQRDQVVEVRGTEVVPPVDVMDPTRPEPHLAVGMATRRVDRPECLTLFSRGEPPGTPDVDRTPSPPNTIGMMSASSPSVGSRRVAGTARPLFRTPSLSARRGATSRHRSTPALGTRVGGAGSGDEVDHDVGLQLLERSKPDDGRTFETRDGDGSIELDISGEKITGRTVQAIART